MNQEKPDEKNTSVDQVKNKIIINPQIVIGEGKNI